MDLITRPNLARPDEAYARLLAAHEGLSMEDSAALNARLVLILVNHVGNEAVIEQALRLAREASTSGGPA